MSKLIGIKLLNNRSINLYENINSKKYLRNKKRIRYIFEDIDNTIDIKSKSFESKFKPRGCMNSFQFYDEIDYALYTKDIKIGNYYRTKNN